MIKKLMASIIILGFLLSGVSVYGFIFVPPPPQTFVGGGFVYAVEYQCGNWYSSASAGGPPFNPNQALPGDYDIVVLVHNNQPKAQIVYMKILAIGTFAGNGAFSNRSLWVKNPNTNHYRFVIQPDGALYIDCSEMLNILNYGGYGYSTGFIIISQPTLPQLPATVAEPSIVGLTPLDVVAAYTYQVIGAVNSPNTGGSNNVVYISGTREASVPIPIQCATSPTTC